MTERLGASFRDPSGFMFQREGVLYRQVNQSYRSNYDRLMSSGLYDALVAEGLLIRHEESTVTPAEPALGTFVIKPERLPFVSYPFEWCPAQLRDAALATLRIQTLALEHGMSLRDATAYNIQFVQGRPLLIDTLSFEVKPAGPWVAYAQFCRHFLAPLALMRHDDVRLGALLRSHLDGVPLDLASRLLPLRTRFQVGLALHIHAHARSQQRHASSGSPDKPRSPRPELGDRALLGLLDSLRKVVSRQVWAPPKSVWRDYYKQRESYTLESLSAKESIIADCLQDLRPRLVFDLGGNTGRFSRIAAGVTGADVISIEMDASAVELNWREKQKIESGSVLPLLNDFANPTPAQGWAHAERESLADRGPADVALALAVIHHLAIGNNVPLSSVLAWLATMGKTVILEWVPKADPMVQRLLSSRVDIFDGYDERGLNDAIKPHFSVKRTIDVDHSARTIYVLERS